ncbi:hypothetical protein EMQ25_01240 [Arsenicitalea aurantiaca]|uniref:Uncharacterized protein n=1 Tax=Arsenicitalea aurantiaca TaxID=1783274 RepID=A0A433XKT1_9HYPH|nr:hypothetical protein [Arsenicitalea aurantiaca]RUT34618.1 hypothetical protein EMQ25_01240 [Arsenicitalea aurantiaca]
MREMLPPLFSIATGLGFLMVLLVGTLARPAIRTAAGRLVAFGLLAVTGACFFLMQGTGASSIGAGGDMFLMAGACLFVAATLITAGLFMQARGAR